MQLSLLLPHLIYQFKDERDLLKAIEELSIKFTKERDKISDYLNDPRLTSAYAAFYLTTNIPKLRAVFEWMPQEWLARLRASAFIDIGAGPGTFSLAFRDWVGERISVQQVETSSLMREQAQRLWQGLYPEESLIQKLSADSDFSGEKLLFFGHSANEMGVEQSLKYVKEFSPEHVLFVEPGTKEFFPKMLLIREKLLGLGYHILFPCPNALNCPLKNSQEDWCHQFIQVRQEQDVERLSQMARKDRRHLPLIVHAFSKTYSQENPTQRVVRVFAETKFSYEWEVCELNELKHFQIMKRGLAKDQQQRLAEVLAGASLESEVEKSMEKSTRVKLRKLNNFSL